VLKDKRGLTLVEVLISLVVLLLVFLALMQTALVSIDSNMINVLRDEAVNVAEDQMNIARNLPFANLVNLGPSAVTRNLRNIPNFSYNVTRTITNINADTTQVAIAVTWTWKGNPYNHTISTILRR